MFNALKNEVKLAEGGFPILITPESDVLGHDTAIGPGFSFEDGGGTAIEDLLVADEAFQPILQDMKAGKSGRGVFSSAAGLNGDEKIYIAYAPVIVRNYHGVNSSDIAYGVMNETTLVYSLALAETESSLDKPFQDIDDYTSRTVNICIIAISIVLMVYIAFHVTTSISKPILTLLEVIKDINR